MIDLARKPESATTPAKLSNKAYYPTLSLSDVYQLDDLPDGEFSFQGVGKVVSHSESTGDDGVRHCSCTIEIFKIKPLGKAQPESLEDALDGIADSKAAGDDENPEEAAAPEEEEDDQEE